MAVVLTEHGLQFRPPDGCRQRMGPVRQVVLHWTGGEGSALQVYQTLSARRLGVHYVVDAAGVVWQMCDERLAAYHVGEGNETSIGIEVVCCGLWRQGGRDKYQAIIHGRKQLISDFYERQYAALLELVDDLVARHNIPRVIPAEVAFLPDRRSFQGVLGHMHWSQRKIDPGTRVFERLKERGYATK